MSRRHAPCCKLWSADDKAIALSALEQLRHRLPRRAARREPVGRPAAARRHRPRAGAGAAIILADEPIASLDPRNTRIVMDALQRINRHYGITVICNLHSLDLAKSYCDRLVGMAQGRVVFDGPPAALTDDAARELYGIEAGDVVDSHTPLPQPAPVLPVAAFA
jgi:phosphonate transport system ATP-binding protein